MNVVQVKPEITDRETTSCPVVKETDSLFIIRSIRFNIIDLWSINTRLSFPEFINEAATGDPSPDQVIR